MTVYDMSKIATHGTFFELVREKRIAKLLLQHCSGFTMVHLVHFYLKEEYKTPEHREKFEAALTKLCEIPISPDSRWGVPAGVPERPVVDLSWDYNLVTHFYSVEDHNDYQKHPDHDEFLEQFKDTWADVKIFDAALS